MVNNKVLVKMVKTKKINIIDHQKTLPKFLISYDYYNHKVLYDYSK